MFRQQDWYSDYASCCQNGYHVSPIIQRAYKKTASMSAYEMSNFRRRRQVCLAFADIAIVGSGFPPFSPLEKHERPMVSS